MADRLYVAQGTEILVFDEGGKANGDIAPSRILATSLASRFSAPLLDRNNDRLYILDKQQQKILVFDNASTSSNALPARSIAVSLTAQSTAGSSSVTSINGLAIDLVRNVLYVNINDSTGCKIGVFGNANTLDGVAAADRVINVCATKKMALDTTRDRLYAIDGARSISIIDHASTVIGGSASLTVAVATSSGFEDITYDAVNDRLYAVDPLVAYQINDASGISIGALQLVTLGIQSRATSLAAIAVK